MTPDEKIQELNLILPKLIKLPPNLEMQFSWVFSFLFFSFLFFSFQEFFPLAIISPNN